jgi:dCMP deaminase
MLNREFLWVNSSVFFSDLDHYSEMSWIADPSLDRILILDRNFQEIDETSYSLKDKKTDLIYLEMSHIWSQNSHCKRMQVGSLIVKNKMIISDGYNGSPSGFPNDCEDEDNMTLPHVLHAEANAITKLARSTQSSDNSTLYVTVSPCFECSKLIIQSGIKKLVFRHLYRKTDSLSFLFQAGIRIVRLKS